MADHSDTGDENDECGQNVRCTHAMTNEGRGVCLFVGGRNRKESFTKRKKKK